MRQFLWRRFRRAVRAVAMLAMLVAAAIAGLALAAVVIRGSSAAGSVVLPATPTAWLDAVQRPGRAR